MFWHSKQRIPCRAVKPSTTSSRLNHQRQLHIHVLHVTCVCSHLKSIAAVNCLYVTHGPLMYMKVVEDTCAWHDAATWEWQSNTCHKPQCIADSGGTQPHCGLIRCSTNWATKAATSSSFVGDKPLRLSFTHCTRAQRGARRRGYRGSSAGWVQITHTAKQESRS